MKSLPKLTFQEQLSVHWGTRKYPKITLSFPQNFSRTWLRFSSVKFLHMLPVFIVFPYLLCSRIYRVPVFIVFPYLSCSCIYRVPVFIMLKEFPPNIVSRFPNIRIYISNISVFSMHIFTRPWSYQRYHKPVGSQSKTVEPTSILHHNRGTAIGNCQSISTALKAQS